MGQAQWLIDGSSTITWVDGPIRWDGNILLFPLPKTNTTPVTGLDTNKITT